MPKTKCPNCGWKGEVERESVGQNLICPECQNEFLCRALKKRKAPGAGGMQRPKSNNGSHQNQMTAPIENPTYQPVTVGNWILSYLLISLPVVNLIMLLVWAFGGSTPISKSNWAKASLIWMLIGIAFYGLMFLVLGATIASAAASAG